MKRSYWHFAIALMVSLTACTAVQTGTSTPVRSDAIPLVQGRSARMWPVAERKAQTLYVLNSAPLRGGGGTATVGVYSKLGANLIRSLEIGKYDQVTHVGFAVELGHLYASASFSGSGLLSIYGNRGANLVRTLQQGYPFGFLALDGLDNLYTSCAPDRVCEYGNSKQRITRKLRKSSRVLAVNSSNDIAVWTDLGIGIFAPHQTQPYWNITTGYSYDVSAAAFDSSGDLYVASGTRPGSIAVYTPGSSSPIRTITEGIGAPMALAFDAAGYLYVLNHGQPEAITVYAPGASIPSRTISDGLDAAKAFCLDQSGNLFVANEGASPSDPGNVTVYAPNGDTPIRTVTQNIHTPIAVATGP